MGTVFSSWVCKWLSTGKQQVNVPGSAEERACVSGHALPQHVFIEHLLHGRCWRLSKKDVLGAHGAYILVEEEDLRDYTINYVTQLIM